MIVPEDAITRAEPSPTPVARPEALTVATDERSVDQATSPVSVRVEPSVNVPAASNCAVRPAAIDAEGGVTAIETKVAGVTVRIACDVIGPEDAMTRAVPSPTPAARPEAFTVATDERSVVQTTSLVRARVERSVKVPVVSNWVVRPAAIVAEDGATLIETKVGAVTVNSAKAEIVPLDALTCAVPSISPVARPLTSTDATVERSVVQATSPDRVRVEASVKVPIASNWAVSPAAIVAELGVTSIETKVAGVTVRSAWAVTAPEDAITRAAPSPTPIANPEASTVATEETSVVQATSPVKVRVDASVKVPVASNCIVVPIAIEAVDGVTSIETKAAGVTVRTA